MSGVTTITIPNDDQTVQNSAPSLPSSEVTTAAAINQAESYGAMKERFEQAQNEAQQIRFELQSIKDQLNNSQSLTQAEISELKAQNAKLLQALEEEEEEIQQQENLNGATVVTPPPILIPTTPENTPKKTQSRWNRALFGKDDDDE